MSEYLFEIVFSTSLGFGIIVAFGAAIGYARRAYLTIVGKDGRFGSL